MRGLRWPGDDGADAARGAGALPTVVRDAEGRIWEVVEAVGVESAVGLRAILS